MKSILAVSILFVVSLAQAASAQGASVVVKAMAPDSRGGTVQKEVTVEYGDLNIADRQDAATLLSRINKAAAAICASEIGLRSLADLTRVSRCRAKAVNEAVSVVGLP